MKIKLRDIYFQKTETKTLKLFSRVILFGLCEVTKSTLIPRPKYSNYSHEFQGNAPLSAVCSQITLNMPNIVYNMFKTDS